MADRNAAEAIKPFDWWHAMEVAPGVVTPGWWDHRRVTNRLPWPASLEGARCLDVGTMDGYWAFEMERRGADEVVASDVLDPAAQDTFGPRKAQPSLARRGLTFEVAAELLGSRAKLRDRSVYDLDPNEDGEFDLVFVGYVLQLVRDPLRALAALRRVCRGSLLLLDTVGLPLALLPAPLGRLDARSDGREFLVFNRRGWEKLLELGGFAVEARTRILRDGDGAGPAVEQAGLDLPTRLRYALGVRGRSVALRAR